METSPFAKLPAELRNNIWALALQRAEPIELVSILGDCGTSVRDVIPATNLRHGLALPRTCKQICRECRDMFYSVNTFLTVTPSPTNLAQSLVCLRTKLGERRFDLTQMVLCVLWILEPVHRQIVKHMRTAYELVLATGIEKERWTLAFQHWHDEMRLIGHDVLKGFDEDIDRRMEGAIYGGDT